MAQRSVTVRKDVDRSALGRRLAELRRLRIDAGVQGPEADQKHVGSDLTVGEIAVIMEYGSLEAKIPARRTHTVAVANMHDVIEAGQARIARRAVLGGGDIVALGDVLAERMAEGMKHELRTITTPPLKPETVARRRRAGDSNPTKPLIFTEQLVDANTGKASLA